MKYITYLYILAAIANVSSCIAHLSGYGTLSHYQSAWDSGLIAFLFIQLFVRDHKS